ncbi:MAG: hypothetical protein K2R98_02675 [Gemmataceae bacterium]|nr:hypothetical protein [Gemmataceae bacterium]
MSAQYRRLAKRRGKKRTSVAVGHTLLVMIYHVLRQATTYAELGANYLDRQEPERLRTVRRLGLEHTLGSRGRPKQPLP